MNRRRKALSGVSAIGKGRGAIKGKVSKEGCDQILKNRRAQQRAHITKKKFEKGHSGGNENHFYERMSLCLHVLGRGSP